MPTQLHPWPAERIRTVRRALLDFFRERRRELPWRDAPTPYGTLVSEVMLQQTRVETVVPFYLRWMERFPDPEALAAAEEEEVLRMWQGLGYYSRARNLLQAVREVVQGYEGKLPRDPEALRSLPGVGPYTAGAVASIAFGQPEPAVDGNVRRVLSRLMDAPEPSPRELDRWAREMVDPDHPGDFNQALMELGAVVCTPRTPSCPACPVAVHCQARVAGTVAERPARRARKPVPYLVEAVAVLVRPSSSGSGSGAVLLQRRPPKGLLAGMWECPGREVPPDRDPGAMARALAGELAGELVPGWGKISGGPYPAGHPAAGEPTSEIALAPVEHAFSHRMVGYRPYLFILPAVASTGAPVPEAEERRWLHLHALDQVPLPVAQSRILQEVRERTLR